MRYAIKSFTELRFRRLVLELAAIEPCRKCDAICGYGGFPSEDNSCFAT